MKVIDSYPPFAVGGSCIVTKDYDVSGGKKVISLDIDVATLPARGVLCLSEKAVELMCVALGWDTDHAGFDKRKELTAHVAELEAENASLREAMQSVLSVQRVVAEPAPAPAPEVVADEPVVEPVVKKAPAKKAAAKKAPAK
jgi:hypothetical protein